MRDNGSPVILVFAFSKISSGARVDGVIVLTVREANHKLGTLVMGKINTIVFSQGKGRLHVPLPCVLRIVARQDMLL